MPEIVRDLAARVGTVIDEGAFRAAEGRIAQLRGRLNPTSSINAARKAEQKFASDVRRIDAQVARAAERERGQVARNAARFDAGELKAKRVAVREEQARMRLAFQHHKLDQSWRDKAARAQEKSRAMQRRAQVQEERSRVRAAEQMRQSNRSMGMAAMVWVGAATYAAGRVLGAISDKFIRFNSDVQQSTISLATQERLMGKAGSWSQAMGTATGLFEHYQEVAKASVGTTQDFLAMHQYAAAPSYASGLDLEQVKKLTQGAVIAAASLGIQADEAGREISQMMAGTIGVKDKFARMLINSELAKKEGLTLEKFRAMTAQQRGATTLKLFDQDAFKESAKAMEGSFAGLSSTFQDTMAITLGKIGAPIFKWTTDKLKELNAWLTKSFTAKRMELFGAAMAYGTRQLDRMVSVAKTLMAPLNFLMMFIEDIYLWGKGESSLLGDAFLWMSEKLKETLHGMRVWLNDIIPVDHWISEIKRFYAALPEPVRKAIEFATNPVESIAPGAGKSVRGRLGSAVSHPLGPVVGGAIEGTGTVKDVWNWATSSASTQAEPAVASYMPGQAPAASKSVAQNVTFNISGATDPKAVAQMCDERIQTCFAEAAASF